AGSCSSWSSPSSLAGGHDSEPAPCRVGSRQKSGDVVISFSKIRARAAKRKGGEAKLMALLPKPPPQKALLKLADDRALAEMAQRIFSAGFVWSVIQSKWPGFEEAFLGFEPRKLAMKPDEFWEGLLGDKRIVRNPQKVMAVRGNVRFVLEIAK